jgi:hypothetical protein
MRAINQQPRASRLPFNRRDVRQLNRLGSAHAYIFWFAVHKLFFEAPFA